MHLVDLHIIDFNHLLPIAASNGSLIQILVLGIWMIEGILIQLIIEIQIFLNVQCVWIRNRFILQAKTLDQWALIFLICERWFWPRSTLSSIGVPLISSSLAHSWSTSALLSRLVIPPSSSPKFTMIRLIVSLLQRTKHLLDLIWIWWVKTLMRIYVLRMICWQLLLANKASLIRWLHIHIWNLCMGIWIFSDKWLLSSDTSIVWSLFNSYWFYFNLNCIFILIFFFANLLLWDLLMVFLYFWFFLNLFLIYGNLNLRC